MKLKYRAATYQLKGEVSTRGILVLDTNHQRRFHVIGLLRRLGLKDVTQTTDCDEAIEILINLKKIPAVLILSSCKSTNDYEQILQTLTRFKQSINLIFIGKPGDLGVESLELAAMTMGYRVLGILHKKIISKLDLLSLLTGYNEQRIA